MKRKREGKWDVKKMKMGKERESDQARKKEVVV
jgi:hypothetical protein